MGCPQNKPCKCMQGDVGRIEAICRAKFKVDADTVLDPEAPQALIALVRKLQTLQVWRTHTSPENWHLLLTALKVRTALARLRGHEPAQAGIQAIEQL